LQCQADWPGEFNAQAAQYLSGSPRTQVDISTQLTLNSSPNEPGSILGFSVAPSRLSSHSGLKHGSIELAGADVAHGDNSIPMTCTNCFTQTTPLWRGTRSGFPLCNACSLFLKLRGLFRPLSLKTDIIKKRNRTSRAILPVSGSGLASTRGRNKLGRGLAMSRPNTNQLHQRRKRLLKPAREYGVSTRVRVAANT
jgi:GATA-binding protein, other eukaryote